MHFEVYWVYTNINTSTSYYAGEIYSLIY